MKVSLFRRILKKALFLLSHLFPSSVQTVSALSSFWGCNGESSFHQRSRQDHFSLKRRLSSWDLTLKYHRHWRYCRPFSFVILCLFLVLSFIPLFSLPLPPMLFVEILFSSLLPHLLPPNQMPLACPFPSCSATAVVLSSVRFSSLHSRHHILQPLNFQRQIAVSQCIPAATGSPVLSSPYFYAPSFFALCTCAAMNTGHWICTHTMQSSTLSEIHSVIPDILTSETACSGTSFCCNYIVLVFPHSTAPCQVAKPVQSWLRCCTWRQIRTGNSHLTPDWSWDLALWCWLIHFLFFLHFPRNFHPNFRSPWTIRLQHTIDHTGAAGSQKRSPFFWVWGCWKRTRWVLLGCLKQE